MFSVIVLWGNLATTSTHFCYQEQISSDTSLYWTGTINLIPYPIAYIEMVASMMTTAMGKGVKSQC